MEREIPRRVPGVLPLVGHRDHVGIVEMRPVAVAAVLAAGRGLWMFRIAAEPLRHVVVKELLAPDHSGERLTLDALRVAARDVTLQVAVELVSFATSAREDTVEVVERLFEQLRRK